MIMEKIFNGKKMICLLWILFFILPIGLGSQSIAVKAKKIYTVSRGIVTDGMLLIQDGKIIDCGKDLEIPWNATEIDFKSRVIVPGLVEAHAPRGYDIPNETNPLTPFVTVLDSIDTAHEIFRMALRDGMTTLNIMPGNETILGGKGAVVKPVGLVVEDMLYKPVSGMKISVAGTKAQTRMGVMAQLRRYFNETKDYIEKIEKSSETKDKKTMVSTPGSFRSPELVKYEAVADLLRGRYPAFVYCPSPSDIIRAHRLSKEYGYACVFVLGSECYKAADYIAQNNLNIILDPDLYYYEKDPKTMELRRINVAREFHQKNIQFVPQSDPHKVYARSLFYQGMKLIQCGLTPDQALKAITIIPARILGLEDQIGSLEKGKLANFLVCNGEPLEMSTQVEFVYIEGKQVYDRKEDERLKSLMEEKIIQ